MNNPTKLIEELFDTAMDQIIEQRKKFPKKSFIKNRKDLFQIVEENLCNELTRLIQVEEAKELEKK